MLRRRGLILLLCVLGSLSVSNAADVQVPRYGFQPGLELRYRHTYSMQYLNDTRFAIDERTEITVRIVRANSDGSFRLVFRRQTVTTTQRRDEAKQEQSPMTDVYRVDLFPDGSARPAPMDAFLAFPAYLFPPLPKNNIGAEVGWAGTQQGIQFICKPVTSASDFVFDAKLETPFDRFVGDTHTARYVFDRSRNRIARSDDTWTHDLGSKGVGRSTTELLGATVLPPEALKRLADESDLYFAAVDAYETCLQSAMNVTPEEARPILDRALADLKAVAAGLRQPDLKADADVRVGEHDVRARSTLHISAARAAHVGRAAPDFDAIDLDGNKVRSADLRGKVVVLDFFYRQCGPCIREFPQLNRLAAEFAGQPVVVLGMSIDRDLANARFVAEKAPLRFRSLRARDLQERFGIEGCPTLIVIDKLGVVRDFRVGYSPMTEKDLSRAIHAMLEHT